MTVYAIHITQEQKSKKVADKPFILLEIEGGAKTVSPPWGESTRGLAQEVRVLYQVTPGKTSTISVILVPDDHGKMKVLKRRCAGTRRSEGIRKVEGVTKV
jgi:hypothetical protein